MCTRFVPRPTTNERGGTLILVLVTLAVLLVSAVGVLQNSVGSWRTAGNDRTTKSALAIAEGGAEYARETLRTQLRAGATLSQKLTTAANNGALVDATLLSAFNGSTGASNATANMPLIASTSFGTGSFQVFLTNDRAEAGKASQSASVISQTDTNQRAMITSFGTGPGGVLATVQEQLRIFDGFAPGQTVPGVIVLPGPTVNFQLSCSTGGQETLNNNVDQNHQNTDPACSSVRQVSGVEQSGAGGCFPTVAVSTNAAKSSVDTQIQLQRPSNFGSCAPFAGIATENFLPSASNPYDSVNANTPLLVGDTRLISVKYLTKLVADVQAVADFHAVTDAGFTLGTDLSPKIVAITGNATFSGNTSGSGILLVTGTLTFTGTASYNGIVLVIGAGNYQYNGSGQMLGATLVANINTPWTSNPAYVGIPTYADNGIGTTVQRYDATNLSKRADAIMPLQIVSFQQLR